LFLWKWNDLPPGRLIPQAGAVGGGRCRNLVIGKRSVGRLGRSRGPIRHKTATPRRNLRQRKAMTVTGLTIHDNVIAPAIPAADLLQ
jgi:hypothetical protein